jgi:hypothetical protein
MVESVPSTCKALDSMSSIKKINYLDLSESYTNIYDSYTKQSSVSILQRILMNTRRRDT